MSYPASFETPEAYLEECVKFLKDYCFLFKYPNTEILSRNVLDNIKIPNLENIDLFHKGFFLSTEVCKDEFLTDYLTRLDKLQIKQETIEERHFDFDIKVPLSKKKRYEILNLVKEIENVCTERGCDLIVDFGSGLGYLDQLIYEISNYKVLGIESSGTHYDGAKQRQVVYYTESTKHVKYVKHTLKENSHIKVEGFLQENFPDHKEFCIVGLHSCADLTVEAMFTFLKMEDAKSMVLMPCCYHRMAREGSRFKNFPLSQSLKAIFDKYEVYGDIGVSFMRLAAHGLVGNPDLYELVFMLLTRGLIELYAHRHGYTVSRNKRKAVKLRHKNDFESYIREAATNGFTLNPKPGEKPHEFTEETLKTHEIINEFDLDELRLLWREMSRDLTFKKAGVFLQLQFYMQSIGENLVLLDRLVFLKEQGIKNCYYKKVFRETTSPRCMAMIAYK